MASQPGQSATLLSKKTQQDTHEPVWLRGQCLPVLHWAAPSPICSGSVQQDSTDSGPEASVSTCKVFNEGHWILMTSGHHVALPGRRYPQFQGLWGQQMLC